MTELYNIQQATDLLEENVKTDFSIGEIVQPESQSAVAPSSLGIPSSTNTSASSLLEAGGGGGGANEDDDDDDDQPESDNNILVPKIVAAGKGTALYMPAILEKVIELSGKEIPNVVYIGTASFDVDKNFDRHSSKFIRRGYPVERLDVSESSNTVLPSTEKMRHLIVEWADIIVCSGGNTLHALLRWKETGLDLLLKEAAEKGAVLCGGSAGAGCWFDFMHSDSLRPDNNAKHATFIKEALDDDELEDWEYVKINGLGIIPGPEIMAVPHYDMTGTNDVKRSSHAKQVLLEEQENTVSSFSTIIGIDENAAFVVEGDKAMVISGDDEATCHVVVVNDETGGTTVEPITPNGEMVSLETLIDDHGGRN